MAKRKKATGAAQTSPKTKKAVEREIVEETPVVNQFNSVTDSRLEFFEKRPWEVTVGILEMLANEYPNSLVIDDFEDNIIGVDRFTGAVVYDGVGMILNYAQQLYEEDLQSGEFSEFVWEDYFRMANTFIEFNVVRGLLAMPDHPECPKPIMMMQL